MFELTGKVAVVTGAASGIGRATAERFAAAGANVVLADVADASALAGSLGGLFVETDVSDEAQVKALMDGAAATYGRIDVSINNAGIFPPESPLPKTELEDMEWAFRVNALGIFYGMKHAVAHMPRGSAIVNTASLASVLGFPTYVAYSASKAAVLQMTKVAALEYGPSGIRVNCVCPSSVDTPMLAAQPAGDVERAVIERAAPLGCIIDPEHVAALMHFLVSDDCPVISGQAIVIDAGITGGFSEGLIDSVMASVKAPVPEP